MGSPRTGRPLWANRVPVANQSPGMRVSVLGAGGVRSGGSPGGESVLFIALIQSWGSAWVIWRVWWVGGFQGSRRLSQGAVFDWVEAVRSDPRPAGGSKALSFKPEADQVLSWAGLHRLYEVGHGHIIPQDLVYGFRKPRPSLLKMVVDTGATWKVKTLFKPHCYNPYFLNAETN